ncbi:MAG: RNA polymerase sigma factor [Porticoccaceae bacterium]
MGILSQLGRKQEFRHQVSASRPRLYRTAYSWCHNPDLADDLVQQTICVALQKYAQLRDLDALNAWLFTIMARCLADYWRSADEVPTEMEFSPVDDFSPEDAAREDEIVVRVRRAVSRLPMEQRQVLTLVDLEGFAYAEVAGILEIPVGTVMSRLSRGRNTLHKRLLTVKREEDGLSGFGTTKIGTAKTGTATIRAIQKH